MPFTTIPIKQIYRYHKTNNNKIKTYDKSGLILAILQIFSRYFRSLGYPAIIHLYTEL